MYKYLNILSLDVVAGACICSMFVADFLNVQLHWATVATLAMCVWLIYTFDHLNDAKNIPHEANTERHRFHQRHFKTLTVCCIVTLMMAALLLFKIPNETVLWGAALSCLVLGYFLLLHLLKLKSSYHKEGTIAVLYAAGVLLGPLSVYEGELGWRIGAVFVQFSLLAFTNLVAFAVFERASDEQDFSPSLVRAIGKVRSEILLKFLTLLQMAIAVTLLFQDGFLLLELTVISMILLLSSLIFLKEFYARAYLYRLVGDAVFLLPAFGLFFY